MRDITWVARIKLTIGSHFVGSTEGLGHAAEPNENTINRDGETVPFAVSIGDVGEVV
jgi:hypothetical protein